MAARKKLCACPRDRAFVGAGTVSLWVRLIGGPHEGRVQKIDDDQVEVVLMDTAPMPVRAAHRNFGLAAASFEITQTRYTRRVVSTPGGSIVYFARAELSDFEALRHVLGP